MEVFHRFFFFVRSGAAFVDRESGGGYTYKKMNLSGRLRRPALRMGEPLAKPKTYPFRQSLPYQGRRHSVSCDGEAEEKCA